MCGTRFDGQLDRIAGMACHGGHSGGSLVHRVAPPRTTHGGFLLFYRQQHTVVSLGMACPGLGADCAATGAVRHEPEGVEEE